MGAPAIPGYDVPTAPGDDLRPSQRKVFRRSPAIIDPSRLYSGDPAMMACNKDPIGADVYCQGDHSATPMPDCKMPICRPRIMMVWQTQATNPRQPHVKMPQRLQTTFQRQTQAMNPGGRRYCCFNDIKNIYLGDLGR